MWISERLKESPGDANLEYAHVVTPGEAPTASGAGPVQVLHPYGVYSVIPAGEPVGRMGGAVLGVPSLPPVRVKEGEVCLYTQGGYLLLTREGKVVVNGKELAL